MISTEDEQRSASVLTENVDSHNLRMPSVLPDKVFNRSYKSRKERPCDLCRKRKQTCKITAGPPCFLCKKQKVECTFLMQPTKRRARNPDETPNVIELAPKPPPQQPGIQEGKLPESSSDAINIHRAADAITSPANQRLDSLLSSTEMGSTSYSFADSYACMPSDIDIDGMADAGSAENHHGGMSYYNPLEDMDFFTQQLKTPSSCASASPDVHKLNHDTLALFDEKNNHNVQAIGLSADLDPFLLSRYKYDINGEYTFKMLSFRQLSGPDPVSNMTPFQVMMSNKQISSLARKPVLPKTPLSEVDQIISPDVGARLVGLFFRFIYPSYPVLSLSRFREMSTKDYPTHLLAVLYAIALPYSSYDEHLCTNVYDSLSEDPLYAIAYKGLFEELHTPTTSTLQTCLLLLQGAPAHPYVADSPFKWTLTMTALSLAQTLGLHYDCSKWTIPAWEIRLRRRLWWVTYVTEIWSALTMGRPSNIDDDNFTTHPLQPSDFYVDSGVDSLDNQTDGTYLSYFVRLTSLMKDVLKRLYSLKASVELGSDLAMIVDAVKPLQIRLKELQADLPPSLIYRVGELRDYKASSATFQLHLLCAEIMLHRTFFRALVYGEDIVNHGDTALFCRHAAKQCFKRTINFASSLTVQDVECFWYSWSRIIFSIASHFGISIWACSPDLEEAQDCMHLLQSWRWTLRLQSKLSRHLMNLGLLRLDAIVGALRPNMLKLDPHVESTRPPNPA